MNNKQIAKVILKAINTKLSEFSDSREYPTKCNYSCDAVLMFIERVSDLDKIKSAMEKMGVQTFGFSEFNEFPPDYSRQYARALWLTWVALMFEEGVF